MRFQTRWTMMACICGCLIGCCLKKQAGSPCFDECDTAPLFPSAEALLSVEDACVQECETDSDVVGDAPLNLDDYKNIEYRDMSLEACVQYALQNARVMRDLGGAVLRSPESVTTVNDPSIAYTDPRFGEEAALSLFDATLSASAFFDKLDRVSNNQFLGTLGVLRQDLNNYQIEISKMTAHGTLLSIRNINGYDYNNQQGNRFGTPSGSFDASIETEMRQPLLQGAGLQFNRIAGPSQRPGELNGVLLARADTDISLSRFEQAVRNLVGDVENAYWDLYFGYRDLSAKIDARDKALETYRLALSALKAEKASKQPVLQAEEQFYRFDQQVIDALNGRGNEGTQINGGGTFRGVGGVRTAERRLRLIMGLPINQGSELIRPTDGPPEAPVMFDWEQISGEAIAQRPELRQQRWVVKQRELELCGNKNFLLPRLDLVGTYRFLGFGNDLLGGYVPFDPNNPSRDSNAYADLASGQRQEWQLGLEFSVPIGNRLPRAAVRNSELRLARERAILREQKREIVFGLSNAVGEVQRAFEAKSAAYNRYMSAIALSDTLDQDLKNGRATADVVLEAHRRLADANIQYHLSSVDYALAIRDVHFEKGGLLDYLNVGLSESQWSGKAYGDSADRESLRKAPLSFVKRDLVIAADDSSRPGVGTEAPVATFAPRVPEPAAMSGLERMIQPETTFDPSSTPIVSPPQMNVLEVGSDDTGLPPIIPGQFEDFPGIIPQGQ